MGVVDSVRAVMWARKRQPDQVVYGVALGHERFSPRELLGRTGRVRPGRLQRPPGSLVGTGAGAAGPLCERLGVGWAPPGRPPRQCRWVRRSARSCTATTR
jgi:hypothetical protein